MRYTRKRTDTRISLFCDDAQIHEHYGPERARAIRAALQSKLVLRSADERVTIYLEAFGAGVEGEPSNAEPQDETPDDRVGE